MALTGTGAGASLAVGGPGAGELTSVTGSRARWHLRLPETPEQAAVGVRGGAYVQSATLPCALAAGSALTAAGARV